MNHKNSQSENNGVLLKTVDLVKKYYTPNEIVTAADNISFNIQAGEIAMIFGPSGSGKTTLLNMISGLDNPDSGEIFFEGRLLNNLTDKEFTLLRLHKISLVFQSFELIQVMSCFDNIAYPLILQRIGKKERKEKIKYFASELGIDKILDRKPNKISIGQKQRVAIARSLVTNTNLILGDEITGNLDHQTTHKVCRFLHNQVKEKKQSFIIVTHNNEIEEYADKVYDLTDGKLKQK